MQFALIIVIGAIIAGVTGSVTTYFQKISAKSKVINTTGIINGTALGRRWAGGGGHRKENRVVIIDGGCWNV